MNEEELLREARIRSVAEPEELTFGELAGELELGAERERRFLQALALVAYRHAVLTARALAGQSLPPVGDGALPEHDGAPCRALARKGAEQWARKRRLPGRIGSSRG